MAKFNKEFYIANNPTVKDSGKTAFEHFVTEGWSLGLAANKEEDVLTGDDVITEVASLSGDEIALLLLKMSAENMRLLDEGSEALDIPQLMITNFDAFKATMKPKEVSKLVEDTPISLAGMDKDDFRFLEKGGTFDLVQALNGFDDSTVVQLFKGFTPEAFEFIEAKGTYELGAKLTSMSAENLATVLAAQTVDGIAFMKEVDSFDLGAEITTMSDQHLVKVLKNVEFGSIRNIEGFNIGARLAKMTDDFLSDSMSEWSEGHLDSLLTLDDFDMGAEMAAMDSTNRARVLGDWGVDSLKAIDAASDAFKISDVVFGSGNMDDFAKIKPSDMLGLLATMNFEDIKSAVKRMTGDNLAFIDSADGFEWGPVMGAVDDSLFAELTGSWDQSSLNYIKGLSAESKHVFDMESRLDNLDKENLKKVLKNEGAWTFFDEMESFDLDDKLIDLSEESFTEIVSGLDEGSDAKTYLRNTTTFSKTLTKKINETLTYLETNKSPVVQEEILDQTHTNQSTYSYDASGSFTDSEGDTLTFSAHVVIADESEEALPPGWEINSDTGVLTGKPATDGDLKIEVTAKDKGGMTVSDTFSINVSLPTNTPFTIRSDRVKAGSTELPSTYGLAADEDLIKLTLAVDMAGISQPEFSHFESITGTELDVVINWDEFETLDASTGKQYHFAPIASSTPIFQAATANAVNGFDRLTVASLDVSGSLSLVDQLDETASIGSQLDLSTIYLNPLDSLGETSLSFSGLVLGNMGVDEMFQPLSSLDLFS